ncbi:hypothetical protein Tco_0703293 [Tanacetum coccineum]|uniref:Uncharacterized protein n=1 Tax=Tanacetum coccineum TaxID=301880 RepID=A0ABQ4Y0A0_9ASTR
MLLLQMKKFSLSSKNLGTKETSNLSLTWLLIKCTNHEEPLLQSSISVYMGKSLVLIRSDSREDKYYGVLYGALLPEGMTNQKMRDYPAYKTYLAFATGAATPKKVRKFKKHVPLSKKKALVAVEEPIEKPFKKRAAKRYGSCEGADFESEDPDEPKGKSINISEGTSLKLVVSDVSKADSSKSEYESWGDSDDDNDDDKQSNDERSEYDDDDKAADINKTDDGEEDDFVHTPDNYVPTDDEEFDLINKEMYSDVNVELKDSEREDERKDDEEMTDAK